METGVSHIHSLYNFVHWTKRPSGYEKEVLNRNPFLKYLCPDNYIEGMWVLGRDVHILTFKGKDYELTQSEVDKLFLRVESQLRKYHFYFMSADRNYLIKLPDFIIEEGRKIGYILALNEIITGKESNWNLLHDAY